MTSHTLQDKIARLRARFIEQLPLRMAEIKRLVGTLAANPEAPGKEESLLRQLHSLKGTSASFGLSSLNHQASQMEDLIKRCLSGMGSRDPDLPLAELNERLAALSAATDSLVHGKIPHQEETQVPFFEPAPTGDSPAREQRSQHLIYLCDDDPLQAEHLSTQIQCFGYQIQTFTDIDAMRQAILNRWPDMVIVNIVFPNGQHAGTDLILDLSQQAARPLFTVFISGRHDFEARLHAVRAGGVAFFQKPVRVMDLVETLDAHTDWHHQEALRILLINDEPEEAAYHAAILEEAGMNTRVSNQPRKVLDVIADFKPDLLLMDMYMPDCGGQDLAKVIRQIPHYLSLPIVYLSGETNTLTQFTAMRVGADGFLTKPIRPEILVSAVVLRAERMRVLRALMTRDSLTGLLNHTATKQGLATAVCGARRNQLPVSLAMVDVDRFKLVNDIHGHTIGDQVLLALARILQQRLRKSDIVGRVGGEEFAVGFVGIDASQASSLIDTLREDFAKIRFYSSLGSFSCTFSAGVSDLTHTANASAETLFESADQALYRAKHAGRNQVLAFFSPATGDPA
ncbi:MAG: diguanylate cyclase [Pseudomonadota bacterium]